MQTQIIDLTDFDEPIWRRVLRILGWHKPGRLTHAAIADAVANHLAATAGEHHSLDIARFDVTKDHRTLFREGWANLNSTARRLARRLAPFGAAVVVLSFGYAQTTATGPTDWLIPSRIVGTWIGHIGEHLRDIYIPGIAIAVLLGALVYAIEFWRVIRGSRSQSAREALVADLRRPVLLIRSFADDEAMIYNIEWQIDADGNPEQVIVASRFEDALSPQLKLIGPLIAVGNPRDTFPDTGAARAHFANESWQLPVVQMIEQSRLIVLVAALDIAKSQPSIAAKSASELLDALSLSPGVRWEIEHIRNGGHLAKLLILLKPPRSAGWRGVIDALFKRSREQKALRKLKSSLQQFLVIHVAPDGSRFLIRSRQSLHDTLSYELAIRAAYFHMFCRSVPPLQIAEPVIGEPA